MAEWFSPISVYSRCGERVGHPATHWIDGNLSTYWRHDTDHGHSITVDLGETKNVQRVRIRAHTDYLASRLKNVDVYVSDDPGNWGTAVADNLSFQATGWNERDLTPKQGRYVRFINIGTLNSPGIIYSWEMEVEVEEISLAFNPIWNGRGVIGSSVIRRQV